MRLLALLLLSFFLITPTLANDEYATRALLKKKIYYGTGTGKVEQALYWSLPLGKFDVTVGRKYPGEGIVPISGSANLAFISSGYIEGAGYGDRGKMSVKAQFSVEDGDTLRLLELTEIDYIYYYEDTVSFDEASVVSRVKLTDGAEKECFLRIEDDKNRGYPLGLGIMTFFMNKEYEELKLDKDLPFITGFSFTKEGAKAAEAAYKAAEAAYKAKSK